MKLWNVPAYCDYDCSYARSSVIVEATALMQTHRINLCFVLDETITIDLFDEKKVP